MDYKDNMTYIKRNGKIYKQTLIEEEIDIAYEEQKLQGWKDAITQDQTNFDEYQIKLDEINALSLKEEYKETLKLAVPFFSGSGVKQEDIDILEENITTIRAL